MKRLVGVFRIQSYLVLPVWTPTSLTTTISLHPSPPSNNNHCHYHPFRWRCCFFTWRFIHHPQSKGFLIFLSFYEALKSSTFCNQVPTNLQLNHTFCSASPVSYIYNSFFLVWFNTKKQLVLDWIHMKCIYFLKQFQSTIVGWSWIEWTFFPFPGTFWPFWF